MNSINIGKVLLCVVVFMGAASSSAMRPSAPYPATVETFFLPQSQGAVYARLCSFLDSAKSRILIAMYWLTDEVVFNKLIELKKRGIDIQIIFDESTPDFSAHINAFVVHNIIPVLSPKINGAMHNKFVVIDNSAVWTGSANFTPTVLKPKGTYFNDENIVIITSPIAAEQYSNAFYFIEKGLFQVYIQSIAKADSRDLPDWLIALSQKLYQNNIHFKEALTELIPTFLGSQQMKLRSFFPEDKPASQARSFRGEEATTEQKAFLESAGYDPKISKREATDIIASILGEEQQHAQKTKPLQEEGATPRQKAFLESHGIESNISKREATDIIGQIMASERGFRYKPYH